MKNLEYINLPSNLELFAKQAVEGFITGMHKSPYHGFSVEFAEHRLYNTGESTKHIDWKLYGRTDKFFVKRYQEETNLRCQIIIDASSSMYYPNFKNPDLKHPNKLLFSIYASAVLMNLLKRQRDAVGMSIYSDNYDFYSPEKGSERHHQMLLNKSNGAAVVKPESKTTETYRYLHQIAEKIHRRSLIFVFTDMFQTSEDDEKLFEALRHLKHNKHEVVLFHVFDKGKELTFDFDNRPKRFIDIETGEYINLYPDNIKDNYEKAVKEYFNNLRLKCGQYRIKYVEADINAGFNSILTTYMIERQKFV